MLFSPKTTYRIRGEEGERKKLSLGLTEHNLAFQTLWEALARVHSFNTHFLGPPISGSDHARPDTKMDEEKTRRALVSRSERRLRTACDKMQSRTWMAGERGGGGGHPSGCWQETEGTPAPNHQVTEESLSEAPFTERRRARETSKAWRCTLSPVTVTSHYLPERGGTGKEMENTAWFRSPATQSG